MTAIPYATAQSLSLPTLHAAAAPLPPRTRIAGVAVRDVIC